MPVSSWDDDSALLADLAEAVAEPAPSPTTFAMEKALFTWRTVDVELAALIHDSATALSGPVLRAETATLRTLTFEAPSMTIEIEMTADGLVGQIVPPRSGVAYLRTVDRTTDPVPVNDLGCFIIAAKPPGSFRIGCETADGVSVVTVWIDG